MGNYKIKVNNEAESKEAQELFIKLGANGNVVQDKSIRFVCTYEGLLTQYDFLPSVDFKEITIQELRLMANPVCVIDQVREQAMELLTDNDQREYLNKLTDGTYKLVVLVGDFSDVDGLIEVPDGALMLTKDLNGYLTFWNGDSSRNIDDTCWYDPSEETMDFNEYSKNKDIVILWVREKESVEVGKTLNERQSQYGEFKDVAHTTQYLLQMLSTDEMSDVQLEALHMICSKLARIRHGDVNYIDSWHDIAGYATLVVKDLESK